MLRRCSLLAAVAAAALVLAGCGGDDDTASAPDTTATEQTTEAEEPDAGTGDDATETEETESGDAVADDGAADGASGVLIQFRGEQLTAGRDDAQLWSCATSGDGQFASVMFLDEAGNDVSVNYDANAGTNASLTLTDGTTWNATEGGVVNATQQQDGTYRLSIQLTEVDSGESESMDMRLSCG